MYKGNERKNEKWSLDGWKMPTNWTRNTCIEKRLNNAKLVIFEVTVVS